MFWRHCTRPYLSLLVAQHFWKSPFEVSQLLILPLFQSNIPDLFCYTCQVESSTFYSRKGASQIHVCFLTLKVLGQVAFSIILSKLRWYKMVLEAFFRLCKNDRLSLSSSRSQALWIYLNLILRSLIPGRWVKLSKLIFGLLPSLMTIFRRAVMWAWSFTFTCYLAKGGRCQG